MKKLAVALLVTGAVLVAAAYVWVDSYTKKVEEREKALLQQQQEAYSVARDKRTRELQVELVHEALRSKLGIADQPDIEIRITRQEATEGGLLGVVEVNKSVNPDGKLETSTHEFRIEFDADNAVRTCEITIEETRPPATVRGDRGRSGQ